MKKTILLIAIITLLTNCSKDEEPDVLVVNNIIDNIELSFSTENYQPELITFSGSVYSVIKNNNKVDFQIRALEVSEVNTGDMLYSKEYPNDFITVPKNGGEWLDGKNFNYALFPVKFKWYVVYGGAVGVVEHTFKK